MLSYNPFLSDNPDTYIYEILSRLPDLDNLAKLNKHPVCNAMRKATAQWLDGKKAEARALKEKEERERREKEEKENDK